MATVLQELQKPHRNRSDGDERTQIVRQFEWVLLAGILPEPTLHINQRPTQPVERRKEDTFPGGEQVKLCRWDEAIATEVTTIEKECTKKVLDKIAGKKQLS